MVKDQKDVASNGYCSDSAGCKAAMKVSPRVLEDGLSRFGRVSRFRIGACCSNSGAIWYSTLFQLQLHLFHVNRGNAT